MLMFSIIIDVSYLNAIPTRIGGMYVVLFLHSNV